MILNIEWAKKTIDSLDCSNEEVARGCSDFLLNIVSIDAEKIAEKIGFQYDRVSGVVWDDESSLKHAILSLCLQSLFEFTGSVYPIFFAGKEGDGLLVEHVGSGIFRLESFLNNFPDHEMGKMFLSKLPTENDQSYANVETIALLCECYSRSYDISLAVSDWAFELENDSYVLSDFGNVDSILKGDHSRLIQEVFNNMIVEYRCDKISQEVLFKALEGGVQC